MKTEDREIFENLLKKFLRRFRCSSGSIALFDRSSETFRVVASRGLQLERLEKGLGTREGVTGLIYRNKKTMLIDTKHPLPSGFYYHRERELCAIVLPLLDSERKVIGVISLNKKNGTFTTSQIFLLRFLGQEIAALAEQIHRREEGEKVTLSLQVEFAKLLQNPDPSDIRAVLEKIAEATLAHSEARFLVLYTPIFLDIPLAYPPETEFSQPEWNACQAFLSPYIKTTWKEKTFQVLELQKAHCPFLQNAPLTRQKSVTVEIHPMVHSEKTLGTLLLFLDKPLSEYRRISLNLLLILGGVLLHNHLLLRETEALARRQEQLKLAQELHNHLTQDLAGIQLYITALEEKVTRKDSPPEEVSSILHTIDLALHRCLDYSRGILDTLQKGVDGEHPFTEKITAILEGQFLLAERKLRYALRINLPEYLLPRDIQEIFLQIIVEATNNILKHAQARQVLIKAGTYKDKIYLVVRDDGKGFDSKKIPLSHGLNLLKKQVLLKKGSFRVSSSPGQGTRVNVAVPIYA